MLHKYIPLKLWFQQHLLVLPLIPIKKVSPNSKLSKLKTGGKDYGDKLARCECNLRKKNFLVRKLDAVKAILPLKLALKGNSNVIWVASQGPLKIINL